MLKKIGLKAGIGVMIIIVLIVSTVLVLLLSTTKNFTDSMLDSQSKAANSSFAHTLDGLQSEALERAEMIAGSNDVINAILNGDSASLLSSLNNLSDGLDLITLCDAEGTVLARTHNDKTGDSVLSQNAIKTALDTGKGISTIEPGTVIGLSTRGSAAIKDANGNIIGALTCGHDLSQSKYVDELKEQNGCEATFFAGDERMSTTLVDESGNRVIGTKASDAVVQTVIAEREDYGGQIELFGMMYAVHYSPLIVDNQVVGMLFTGVNIEDALKQERNMLIMIAVAIVMLLLAIVVTAVIIGATTRKSHWYESMLDSIPFPISVTDMNMNWTFFNKPVEQMLNIKRSKMLGKHCSNWGAGICKTDNCGIACLKNGKHTTYFEQMGMDFQVDIHYLHDARGKSVGHIEIVQDISEMIKIQKAQTKLVEQIRDVSLAFVNATRQIASGSQSLAEGSAEQASTIQELSASVSEISQKTQENAEMAVRASELADRIKSNAEKGSQQMSHMTAAVNEINNASQSINQVIKVIDDIAFQTNILALNAAVEAARAGQHGKGFAVVAEEVRNLASKSAEAAKDTGQLIANSMEKAALGTRISHETAASLNEIVSGIIESSKLISDIAKLSGEQSQGVSQINTGIEQVADVVNTNSATAQESSAAAQELSDQSRVLEDLLNNYGSNN